MSESNKAASHFWDAAYWLLVSLIVLFNAYWFSKSYWPVPDLKTINRSIGRGNKDEAEAALVQRLENATLVTARAG